jgi:hypothetical protein
MWMLNTDYISFRPHRDRNFVPIGGERQAVNQDAMVKLIGWAGNLTVRGSQFQGRAHRLRRPTWLSTSPRHRCRT